MIADQPGMDDLDRHIAKTITKHPEFEEMLNAAVQARELIAALGVARRRAKLTQTQVAVRIGTTQAAIARFESGDSDPRISTVSRYAEAIGMVLTLTPRAP